MNFFHKKLHFFVLSLFATIFFQNSIFAQSDLSKRLSENSDFVDFYQIQKNLKKEIFEGVSKLSKEEKASLKKRLEAIRENENSEALVFAAINYSYEKFSEYANKMEISIDKFTPKFSELSGLGVARKKTITDAFIILDGQTGGDIMVSTGFLCNTLYSFRMSDAASLYSGNMSACSSKGCKATAKKLLMEQVADCTSEWSSCNK